MATLLTQIKIKRDTYDNLKNVVLAAGEPAIAIIPNPGTKPDEAFGHMQFAVGDGSKTFAELSLKIKDGVTNLTGTGAANQIALFTGANDIKGCEVYIDSSRVMSGITQMQINNAENVAPLTINKKALVTNLDADYLDGQHGSYYFSSDWLGFTENAANGNFPLLKDSNNKLYVNISSAVSNKKITIAGNDITITNPNFTLNQNSDQTVTLTVSKNSSGARPQDAIVSAVASGTIQSNNYQVSYTPSGQSGAVVGATIAYDQALQAVKFIF